MTLEKLSIEELFTLADLKEHGSRRKVESSITVSHLLDKHGIRIGSESLMRVIDQLAYFGLVKFYNGEYTITPDGIDLLKSTCSRVKVLMLALDRQVGY